MNKLAKPLFVHLHIFYIEMWPELHDKLESLSHYPYELYVTLVAKHEELEKEIIKYNPKAKIEIVENRGFDVAPFIHIINQINLDDYSYVVKIHSKRIIEDKRITVNCFPMHGTKWKDYLLDFLSSKRTFDKYLNALEKNTKYGMLSNFRIILHSTKDSKTIKKVIGNYYKKYNMEDMEYNFIAGTMFIAKTDVFKKIQAMKLSIADFEPSTGKVRDGELAHVMERFIGLCAYEKGYIIKDPFTPFWKQVPPSFYYTIMAFLYQNHVTKKGKRIIKICKIPVYYMKVKRENS